MPNLVPFEEIEAIILLSVCQFILKYEMPKNSMLMVLSNILRNYAKNKGKNIDDSFRSTSGLSYQTNVMLKYLSSNESVNRAPKMFITVNKKHQNEFLKHEQYLWEGLIMSSESEKQAFLRFLTTRRPQSASYIFWSLEKAEEYLKTRGVLNGSMYEGLSLYRIECFESIISKDNNFIKKYKEMIYSLKMGFSVMKEYVVVGTATEKKPDAVYSETKGNSANVFNAQMQTGKIDFEIKTETIENNHIDVNSIPVSFVYYNRTVDGLESWSDLYVKFMKIFWAEKGRQLSAYIGRSFINDLNIDLGDSNTTRRMKKPKRIADNVFLETNLVYRGILSRIKAVLDKTSIPAKRFSITYKQPVSIKREDGTSLSTVNTSSNMLVRKHSNQENPSPVVENSSVSDNHVYKLNFNIRQELIYTKPLYCSCDGMVLVSIKSWTDLYTTLFSHLWNKHKNILSPYIGKCFVYGKRCDLLTANRIRTDMVSPKYIGKDIDGTEVYLETNFSANNIVSRIKSILEICHIPFENTVITYAKKDDVKTRMISEPKKLIERITASTSDSNFVDWLVKNGGVAEVTANHYYSSVRRAEGIAWEQGLASQRLLSAETYQEAQATYHELLSNQKFISMNATAHNGFTASINKYLQYLLSGGAKSFSSMSKPMTPRYDKELMEKCLAVLAESFTNGIKKDAGIAKRKFRNAYAEKYGMDLSEDIDLDDLFRECALEYDGKFYVVSSTLTDFIREQLKDYSAESDMLFFYDIFYDKNMSLFSEYGVTTPEMLKSVLEKKFPDYYYKSNCFATRRGLTLEQVVNAAYGDDVCLSIDELQNRLPFIGAGQILPVLSRNNSGYVRVNDGTYAMRSRVHIVQSDVELSKQIVENDIRTLGYSFIKSLIVEESGAKNPEISEQALQLVLFDLYLANDFSRNRGLISPLGEADSVVGMLSNYCKKHNRITLEEVEEYEKEFTGGDSARRSLRVVTDAMIRVSEDTFMAQIDFDVAAVDNAIEPFFRDRKIISLKNVSSFSVFPDVEGVAWNSCLLASYLRRYSERWGFIGEEHKKKSVGAIFDKSLTFDSYDDAIAQAVAESGIELTQEEVSCFLLQNEYRLRNADFKDIISKAYQIRVREE